jgi:hypothetical protein
MHGKSRPRTTRPQGGEGGLLGMLLACHLVRLERFAYHSTPPQGLLNTSLPALEDLISLIPRHSPSKMIRGSTSSQTYRDHIIPIIVSRAKGLNWQ